jgi:hypothetical protein
MVKTRAGDLAAKKQNAKPGAGANVSAVSAGAALSFLKDTKGTVSWSEGDLADVLKIGRREAEQVVALLEAQGYVTRAEKNEWMTTAAGEAVSGAKMPRFTRESVEQALGDLRARIAGVNKDRHVRFKIAAAVAFGDFLLKDRVKVQAADVGLRLVFGQESTELRSASDAKQERKFLNELRGKAQMLNMRPYAEWMSKRLHRELL